MNLKSLHHMIDSDVTNIISTTKPISQHRPRATCIFPSSKPSNPYRWSAERFRLQLACDTITSQSTWIRKTFCIERYSLLYCDRLRSTASCLHNGGFKHSKSTYVRDKLQQTPISLTPYQRVNEYTHNRIVRRIFLCVVRVRTRKPGDYFFPEIFYFDVLHSFGMFHSTTAKINK
jgi:hypothetical protein